MAHHPFRWCAMARQSRFDIPGVPQHVIQRGNNRQPCFLNEQDYRFYLEAGVTKPGSHGSWGQVHFF